MKIHTAFAGLACALLLGAAPLANADSMSLNSFKGHVLPVLVTVNSQGKITSMSPAYSLHPRMQRLLRTTLDQMVTGPAKYHGKAMSSQAVIKLALKTDPQKDDTYKVRFAYAGAVPLPYGSWYWNHIDGHRLALVNESMRGLSRPRRRMVFDHAYPQRMIQQQRIYRSRPMPAQRQAPMQRSQARPAPAGRSR